MLKEDQAAELLRQCEGLLGRRLGDTRDRLGLAEHRAGAIWELIVMDSAGQIGRVSYQPQTGSSRPDIKLQISADRTIWLEATFLHPRFWKEELKREASTELIVQELRRRNIPPGKVHFRFATAVRSDAGPKVELPELRERDLILREPGLSSFLDAIEKQPSEDRSYKTPHYSLSLVYTANADSRFIGSSAPRLDAPQTVLEHGLHRALVEKADQHSATNLPLVICVGSDASPVLTSFPGPNQPENRRVVEEFFRYAPWVSAVVVVAIKSQKPAEGEIFRNSNTRFPLRENEFDALLRLDFNRWAYTFPLTPRDAPVGPEWIRRVWGNPILRPSGVPLWRWQYQVTFW